MLASESIHSHTPLLNTEPGALLRSWNVAGGHRQALLPVSFLERSQRKLVPRLGMAPGTHEVTSHQCLWTQPVPCYKRLTGGGQKKHFVENIGR